MKNTAMLVKGLLCWAFSVVADENSRGKHFPGPRISQFSLGDMLVRTDSATTSAIAAEIQRLNADCGGDDQMETLINCIRSGWGEKPGEGNNRVRNEDAVLLASRLVTRVMQLQPARHREILEAVCRLSSYSKACVALHGRNRASLKDDFEIIADRFYHRERGLLFEAAEYLIKIKR